MLNTSLCVQQLDKLTTRIFIFIFTVKGLWEMLN